METNYCDLGVRTASGKTGSVPERAFITKKKSMKRAFWRLFAVCGALLMAVLMVSCDNYHLDKRIKLFEEDMEAFRAQADNVGMSVVFIKDGEIVYVKHWGLKRIDSEEILPDGTVKRTGPAMDDETMMRVASISKTFTATGLMQLIEKGAINLRMDVSDLLGYSVRNPKFPDTVITLEMLMSHTSSLNGSGGYNDYEPGNGYQYCDYNYTLCGRILERYSGERFDEYINKHILAPLGLHGGFNVDSVDREKFASLYQWEGEKYVCQDEDAYAPRGEKLDGYKLGEDTYLFSPASGLKMSALDLAKYVQMHMNYGVSADGVRIIPEELSKDMQVPRSFVGDEHYGVGLLRNATYAEGIDLVGHLGGAWGMRGMIFFNPEERYGFVELSNGAHDTLNEDANMMHNETIRRMLKWFVVEEVK